RREERAWAVRWRAGSGRYVGCGRGRDRGGFARPGHRNGGGAGLRGCARRRLSARAGRGRPRRPDPVRGGGIRGPRAPGAPGGGAVVTGEATRLAAVEVRAKATEVAAELMQQDADALAVVDGKVVCKGAAGPSITLGEIAAALEPASKLRGTRAPGLSAEGWFYTEHMNYPYGVHVAVAKVDRETGGESIARYLLAYD